MWLEYIRMPNFVEFHLEFILFSNISILNERGIEFLGLQDFDAEIVGRLPTAQLFNSVSSDRYYSAQHLERL